MKNTTGNHPKKQIAEKSCRQKRNAIEHCLQMLSHADVWTTKRGRFQRRNSKIYPLVVKSNLETKCKRLNKGAIRGNLNLKTDKHENKIQQSHTSIVTTILKKKGSVSKFLHLCLNLVWAPGPKHVVISSPSSSFQTSPARYTFPALAGTPTSRRTGRFHDIVLNKITAVTIVEQQKTVNNE